MTMLELLYGIPPFVWLAFAVPAVVLLTVAYLILLERKIASWAQDRLGPNRVGLGFGIVPIIKNWKMGGLGQPMADGLKFLLKEDFRPAGVDRILFTVAPMLMMGVIFITIAVIPWGGIVQRTVPADSVIPAGVTVGAEQNHQVTYQFPFQIADLNIGVLFIIAFLSLAVYGVVVGGWASNNKYSFLGGLRATANMISYEVPLGLTILTIALMYGTLDLGEIVRQQAHYWAGIIPAWNVFCHPVAFVLFLVCIHAEANRAPFDIAEAEQELVGGYHTEYSSMRFALFFLAEYAGMITTSAVCVALFFGGWHLPWIEWLWPALAGNVDPNNAALTTSILAAIVRSIVFFTKLLGIIGIFMWVRWSLPRFRFDQIMSLAWRGLIPISGLLMVATALAMWFFGGRYFGPDLRIGGRMALVLLIANIAVVAVSMIASRIIPAAPPTNRRIAIPGSRFTHSPLPASTGA